LIHPNYKTETKLYQSLYKRSRKKWKKWKCRISSKIL